MKAISQVAKALERQRGYLFGWAPVFLGIGIGFYFCLPREPDPWVWYGLALASVVCLFTGLRKEHPAWIVVLGFALVLLGAALVGIRSDSVREPVLKYRYYGPVEGVLLGVDRSASDKMRITLGDVNLGKIPPEKSPAKVRISIHTSDGHPLPGIGSRIMLAAHLSPPNGPAEPGGFDFQRHAWFQSLGAVGYTRTPIMVADPPKQLGVSGAITKLRFAISDYVRARLPGSNGGFAAAVVTGDRSGMSVEILEDLRASNLAHLLAISGLHMGLLTGVVFGSARFLLACIPYCALRWPTKKVAAVLAVVAGGIYLALSGGSVATERAFIMVSVVFAAILMDRRALTLRAVSIAALIILIWRPESLISAGFQMSFAATTALIFVFGHLRGWETRRVPAWAKPVVGVLLSSAIAGAATAPIGAAHFNQVSHYGLIANVLSVPLMGAIVIPGAVLAAILSPFGLAWIGLWIMSLGISWILFVADSVAGWGGALSFVPMPPPFVLPVIALGGLVVVLWQGRERYAGVLAALVAVALWVQAPRPPILIAANGGLIGVLNAEGRVLSKPRGEGFAARSWLENDGDPLTQKTAALRQGFEGANAARFGTFYGLRIAHLTGKSAAANLGEACRQNDLVVTNIQAEIQGCLLFDLDKLKGTGAIAVYPDRKARFVTVKQTVGRRPWNTH